MFICFVESNIDEVLSLSDLSGVPAAFLTEIEQDKVYETIYQELQKKLPLRNQLPASTPPPLPTLIEPDERKSLSPHLLTMEGDEDMADNDTSVNEEVSSSASSEIEASSGSDGYDTDIETGEILLLLFS